MSEELELEPQQYFFDDFFVPEDDPGVQIEVKMGKSLVPIYIKRNLTLEDIEAAKEAAIVKKMNFKTKEYEVLRVDETVFIVEILYRAIKSWPFEFRTSHKKVPITRENIRAMMHEGAESLAGLVQGMIEQKQDQAAPFEKASGAVS